MTDPLTALRDVPAAARLSAEPIHARIDELAAARPRRRRRGRLPALSLVAIAGAAVAVVLTTGGTPTTVEPSAATAATVLHALGQQAAATGPVQLRDGEYYAIRIRQFPAQGQKGRTVDSRTWANGDQGREQVLVDDEVKRDVPLGAPNPIYDDVEVAVAKPGGGYTTKRVKHFEPQLPDPSTFPTEPKALAARMREEAAKSQLHPGTEPTARDYITTAMAMFFSPHQIPADVLRGTYDFLATLPGMRLIGDVKDPLGRPGKAVAVDGDPDTQEGIGIELILDPDSGLPLAYVHYRDGNVNDPWLNTTRQAAVVKGTDALPG